MNTPQAPAGAATNPTTSTARSVRDDFFASLVVFMVALPLCIGIAQACGLPAMAGIVTGIVGGLVVGFLAGSPLQVSGPAAGLIVLVIDFFDTISEMGYNGAAGLVLFGVVVGLCGMLQILAGVFRLGPWFRAVSPAVVGGMLAGIGITIIAKQFHVLVDDKPPRDVVEGLLTIPSAVWKGFSPPVDAAANHRQAAIIGVLTFLVLASWKAITPKSFKLIPSAVVAVSLAVLVAEVAGFAIDRVQISGNIIDGFQPIAIPSWEIFGLGVVWKAAFTFALIASAETLLCAVAVDTLHAGKRTNYDRELVAQGVGNVICGTVAALPMTGVIVRSSANVEAGAKTRLSAILHGVWLLLFVALLPVMLSRIPLAALAAVLVYTGWKLVGIPEIRKLWQVSKSEALIYVATAGTIVATDLLTGVLTGLALSAIKLLVLFSHLRIDREDEPEHHRVHLYVEGAATFLRLPQFVEQLEAVPPGKKLHIHLERVQLVDHAVLQLLVAFQKRYEATGGTLYIDWDRLFAHFHTNARRDMPQTANRPLRPGAADPEMPPHASEKGMLLDSPASNAHNAIIGERAVATREP